MRIDRRGNPAFRKFPEPDEPKGNIDLTGNAGPRPDFQDNAAGQEGISARDRPSAPSEAFEALEVGSQSLMRKITGIFAAVGQALKDIKQGETKTFD